MNAKGLLPQYPANPLQNSTIEIMQEKKKREAGMEYGFSIKCISPRVGTKMAGYVRQSPSLGIVDDLYAQALVLTDREENRFLIVCADIIGFDKDDTAEIRAVLKERFGIPENAVILNASHTHFGPATIRNFLPKWESGELGIYNEEYCNLVKNKIYEAIEEAFSRLNKCVIEVKTIHSDFGINRRTVESGKAISRPNPSGSIDDSLTIAVLKNLAGTPETALINYAAHPTNMLRDYISADYPGILRRQLQSEFAQSLNVMFLQGAAGDISVRKPEKYESGTDVIFQTVSKLEKEIAGIIRGPMNSITCGNIKSVSENVTLPLDQERDFSNSGLEGNWLKKAWQENMPELKRNGALKESIELECNFWKFDDKFCIVTLEGEVCHEIALMARKIFKSENMCFLGYTNGSPCYIPSEKVIEEGGYEGEYNMVIYSHQSPFKKGIEKKLAECFCTIREKIYQA